MGLDIVMKNAYIAICYTCNENCLYCPCSKNEKLDKMIVDIAELKSTVDILIKNGVTDVTISGGEPTLHPFFIELVSYIQERAASVTVLTNGERFSDREFLDRFLELTNINQIKVITTIHSDIAEEHEKANQTSGSFDRTIEGLNNLERCGVRIIIKHCVTRQNYRELKRFYLFCDEAFSPGTDIQLCSIDYCGVPRLQIEEEMLSFVELRPYLEELFEYHDEMKKSGSKRNLYGINFPLCSCDVAYWDYFPARKEKMYSAYKDPYKEVAENVPDHVGVHEIYCKNCKVNHICCGTYSSAFELFGGKIVRPYT